MAGDVSDPHKGHTSPHRPYTSKAKDTPGAQRQSSECVAHIRCPVLRAVRSVGPRLGASRGRALLSPVSLSARYASTQCNTLAGSTCKRAFASGPGGRTTYPPPPLYPPLVPPPPL